MTSCDPDHHCITCGDDGVPMRVLRVDARMLATCLADDGAHHTVDVELVGDVGPGDNVLVDSGYSTHRERTLELLAGPEDLARGGAITVHEGVVRPTMTA